MKQLLITTALILSLSVGNVAFAHDDESAPSTPGSHWEIASTIDQLPVNEAADFRHTMVCAHEKNKPLYKQMHSLHEDLRNIVTAENFDKTAFLAKTKQLQALHDRIEANKHEALANALGRLSQDERTSLADAMHQAHGHRHWHHDHASHNDGDGHATDDHAPSTDSNQ